VSDERQEGFTDDHGVWFCAEPWDMLMRWWKNEDGP
jgi:hypothetical protein